MLFLSGGTVIIGSGTKLTDTANLTGGYGTLTGTVTFTLTKIGSASCRERVYTATGAGTYKNATDNNPARFLPTATGSYLWHAVYSGDSNNNGAQEKGVA